MAAEQPESDAEFREQSGRARRDYAPEGAEARPGAWPTLKRTVTEFQEDNLSDWAAALTYYSLLALFPALIAMVSLIGIFGDPQATTDSLTEIIEEIGPASAAETFKGPIESITESSGTAGSPSSPAWRRRCGRPPATSAPSRGPRTSSTRRPRGGRSGSCARCRSRSPWR